MYMPTAIIKPLYPKRNVPRHTVAGKLLEATLHFQANNDPKGYFAALYYHVATRISHAIECGIFPCPEGMESLNTIFCDRYLEAIENDENDYFVSHCWTKAFEAGKTDVVSVKQHLLLGMNAHINFDLPLAAIEAFPGITIIDRYEDFLQINKILYGLYNHFLRNMATFWPTYRLLHIFNRTLRNHLLDPNMRKIRERAWIKALYLAGLEGNIKKRAVHLLDRQVGLVADKIIQPRHPVARICKTVKYYEKGTVSDRINALLAPCF